MNHKRKLAHCSTNEMPYNWNNVGEKLDCIGMEPQKMAWPGTSKVNWWLQWNTFCVLILIEYNTNTTELNKIL